MAIFPIAIELTDIIIKTTRHHDDWHIGIKSKLIISKPAVKIGFKMTRHSFDRLGVLFNGSVIIALFSLLESLIMINFSLVLIITLFLRSHFNCRIENLHKFMVFWKILSRLVVVSSYVERSIDLKKRIRLGFQEILVI